MSYLDNLFLKFMLLPGRLMLEYILFAMYFYIFHCWLGYIFRAIVDFPKFLGIAMETFLTMCDDTESDVRMVADECLNRSIKVKREWRFAKIN